MAGLAKRLLVAGGEVSASISCYKPGVLEYRILGPLEVVDDARPLALGGQRQRALLAALLLRPGNVVPTERLVDEIWGEQAPRTATTSLQNAVAQLRKVLGPDVLETQAPGYVLRVDRRQIDVSRFEKLLADARTGPAETRAATLRAALDLWRGPALPQSSHSVSSRKPRSAALEELRLVAAEERIAADIDAGRHADVVAELESLTGAQPLRERSRSCRCLRLPLGRQRRRWRPTRGPPRLRGAGDRAERRVAAAAGRILRQEPGLDPGAASHAG